MPSDSRHPPLRPLIQFLAHVLEQFRLRLGWILADRTRLRHSKRRNAMRRVKAFIVHPGDDLATLRVLGVTKWVIASERRIIPLPVELRFRRPGKSSPASFTLLLVRLSPRGRAGVQLQVQRQRNGVVGSGSATLTGGSISRDPSRLLKFFVGTNAGKVAGSVGGLS